MITITVNKMKKILLTISATTLLIIGQSATAFEQLNSENGYDPAFHNGWVSPESASANLDLVKPSYRSISTDAHGQFEDPYSINYISTH